MADTKFLIKKGKTWYLNVTIPKRVKSKVLAGKKIRISLNTADFKVAQCWRDRHVYELMNAENELYLLECLARKITEADSRLQDKLEELLPSYKIRGVEDKKSISISELMDLFLKHLQERKGLKASSCDKYRSALDCFKFIIGPDTPAISITHEMLQDFTEKALRLPTGWSYSARAGLTYIDLISEVKKDSAKKTLLSHNSIHNFIQIMKAMYDWGIDNDRLPRGFNMPFKRKLSIYVDKEDQKHKRPPSQVEADKLCTLPFPNTDTINKEVWKYLPLIARYTGMRLAEIAQLHKEDVVKEEGYLCIKVCHDVKTSSSKRIIPISDKLQPHIEELLQKTKSGRFFTECGDFKSIGYVKYAHGFCKLWNRAAKKISPDLSFHCWRVYANTQMTRAQVDIIDREKLLGHANDRTNASYLPSDYERLKKAVDNIL